MWHTIAVKPSPIKLFLVVWMTGALSIMDSPYDNCTNNITLLVHYTIVSAYKFLFIFKKDDNKCHYGTATVQGLFF